MSRKFIALIVFFPFFLISCAEMEFPEGDWVEKTPESQGINPEKLNRALAYLADQCGEHKTDQTVVIRNGYLIWKGNDIDNIHNVWSCSKSFTSTVLGLLIDEHKCQLDTKAKDHVSSLQKQYPDVSLRHFAAIRVRCCRRCPDQYSLSNRFPALYTWRHV
jgi:CubicO group peptidase (beta-lactamase class C family)